MLILQMPPRHTPRILPVVSPTTRPTCVHLELTVPQSMAPSWIVLPFRWTAGRGFIQSRGVNDQEPVAVDLGLRLDG